MAGTYEIWLADDRGRRKQIISDWLSLDAAIVDGDRAPFSLILKPNFDDTLINKDWQIHVWRGASSGSLSLLRAYFIRRWRYSTFGGEELITLRGWDSKDILRRRIVAYYAGETESDKTDYTDDMMKEIAEENLGATAATGRDVSSLFTIAADLSAGPTLTKQFAWRNVLDVMQDLQEAARAAGTEVFFDVVPIPSTTTMSFDFRTYTGQPGQDLTTGANQVVFDQERGNMTDPFLEYDYTEAANYIYAAGQGEETDRELQEVSDTDRINESFWSRAEAYADARLEETANGVREEGRALLEKSRPTIRFGADAMDTRGTQFGRDWNWGDKVIARYRGFEFKALIRAVGVNVTPERGEMVGARLEFEEFI